MFSHPMSPEMVRVVHERQVQEAAMRRTNLQLPDPDRPRLTPRRVIGAALIRAGHVIAREPFVTVHQVRPRPEGSGC